LHKQYLSKTERRHIAKKKKNNREYHLTLCDQHNCTFLPCTSDSTTHSLIDQKTMIKIYESFRVILVFFFHFDFISGTLIFEKKIFRFFFFVINGYYDYDDVQNASYMGMRS
jgi:hypothetical protein